MERCRLRAVEKSGDGVNIDNNAANTITGVIFDEGKDGTKTEQLDFELT